VTDTVETLCYAITEKFLRIFLTRTARISAAFSASDALQGRFSGADYHPLMCRVRKDGKFANKIVVLSISEFFQQNRPKGSARVDRMKA
jgi:hypothetical protein